MTPIKTREAGETLNFSCRPKHQYRWYWAHENQWNSSMLQKSLMSFLVHIRSIGLNIMATIECTGYFSMQVLDSTGQE